MTTDTLDLYTSAMSLAASLDENFLDLGRMLRDMQTSSPEEFSRFKKKSSLGSRKCYYLIEIDEAFRKLPVGRDRLRRLGWTKARHLTKHITKENYQKLLLLAETNTADHLKRILAANKADIPKKKAAVFNFEEKELSFVNKVLLRFGAKEAPRGMLKKEEALLKALRKLASQS